MAGMVARAPVWAYVIWLATMFSPFVIVVVPLALRLPVISVAVALVLASIASEYIYLTLIRNTRRRVLQSLIRAKALREDKPFVLISRSYNQSKIFRSGVSIPVPGIAMGHIALFEALIYDLSHEHPIVVMGDKDLHPDDPAGRALYMSPWLHESSQGKSLVFSASKGELFVPAMSWEDVFLRLAHHARFVLLIPSLSEGLLREIALLKKEALGSKTVVYMWPAKSARAHSALSANAQEWEALREPLGAYGLDLPPHSPQGALFRLNDEFAIRATYRPLPWLNILTPVVADDDERDLTPLRDVAPIIEAYELMADAARYEPMWGFAHKE